MYFNLCSCLIILSGAHFENDHFRVTGRAHLHVAISSTHFAEWCLKLTGAFSPGLEMPGNLSIQLLLNSAFCLPK